AMTITRGSFLKLAAAATGAGISGMGVGAAGAALPPPQAPGAAAGAAGTPGGGAGAAADASAGAGGAAVGGAGASTGSASTLDSQRFRAAVAAGDAALVTAYLERDPALAWSRDERGRSVLEIACLAGRHEVAALLRRQAGQAPALDLVEAVLAGDGERVQWWLGKAPGLVNEPDATGWNAVHAAVLAGKPALVMALTVRGADFNALSSEPPRKTPLRLAAEAPDDEAADELVDLMLGNGGDPYAEQGDGVTPLHAAAAAGRRECIRLLIWSGADAGRLTPAGETALALAERHGRGAAAALLREAARLPRAHRSSRFAVTASGSRFERPPQPALPPAIVNEYVAVSHGSLPRMRELLALYPALLLVNASWNELAVEAGAHTGFKDGVRLQLDQGAPCALPTAAMMGMTAHVRALLREDPRRIHECGAHNMPLPWFPAIGGGSAEQLEIARLLLDGGADVNAHKRGQTALHWAARGGHVEMAELLLARGAGVEARAWLTPGGRETTTPLALAQKGGHAAVIELLRRHGATV
ncbi:MAG TPA: ankyrin repeat domain-containing protein, partial [Thermoanaerobaculia bacterium]|nr:ankyrin repeat domain-containing protein [Thermoanaerobaculia bacterium]